MNLYLKERLNMSLRGSPASKLIKAFKKSQSHKLGLSLSQLESQFLAGGDPFAIVDLLVQAREDRIELEWYGAYAIDLATKHTADSLALALAGAKTSRRFTLEAELSSAGKRPWRLEAIVTHRVNLARYVGGADLAVLKERISKSVAYFYEENKHAISSVFPLADLEASILESQLDAGTKLTLESVEIKVR
ncbi:flotillin-like FloA family protein [Pelagicoccus enzymogenes]|uniref:flotillin-like FloA family protein n=1 Tax=Pelagicoccus enzymogenes TaxID=2773457 RepID=UPI00280EBF66|nr:flotillin-like FloA family protein [Pelagicoccus enzymogenes]MDQ8200952.1 flotillin-like FloA family protein [Pelagicoccus enzymogenes]